MREDMEEEGSSVRKMWHSTGYSAQHRHNRLRGSWRYRTSVFWFSYASFMKEIRVYTRVKHYIVAYMLVLRKAMGQTQEKGSDMVQSIIYSIWWWLQSVDNVWKCIKMLFLILTRLTWCIFDWWWCLDTSCWYMHDQIWQWTDGTGSGGEHAMLLIKHCWHYV